MAPQPTQRFRCVLHGSFRKHFKEIKRVYEIFTAAGIEVIAPEFSDIASVNNGFAYLKSDNQHDDPRLVELLYLRNLKKLGQGGFSYFVDPDGYIGRSTSYELGIAQLSNVRCFFIQKPVDHPVYAHQNSVWSPESLVAYITKRQALPSPQIRRNERKIHKLWEELMAPGSVVAVGGIIEYAGQDAKKEKQILLVKTHKWGNQYSVVGGKVRRNERLSEALVREIKEETGLNAQVGAHLTTFDQIKNSGYYVPGIQHIFVDNVVQVGSKRVRLNEEAQEYIWMPARAALRDLPIEPNARHIVELYAKMANS